jgi:hypothetical protein
MGIGHRAGARYRAPLVLLIAALLALLAAPAASQAAQPGVVLYGNGALGPQSIPAVRKLGVHRVRVFMPWASIEPSAGVYDGVVLGAIAQELARLPRGTQVVADITGSPPWENGTALTTSPPADPAAYAGFARFLAARFARRVQAWEIWNEEDASQYWSGGPSPMRYTQLLRAAYPAIKSVDPHATVLVGGLIGGDYAFLRQIYADGGKGYFDAVAVHTDLACNTLAPSDYIRDGSQIDQYAFLSYRSVHTVMAANGDGSKPIWVTELGWSTAPGSCDMGVNAGKAAAGVSPSTQASYLLQAYHCLNFAPYVTVALWFSLTDGTTAASSDHFGLLGADMQRKPAFTALEDYVKAGDQLRGGCGNFTPPQIQLLSPVERRTYSGPLPIDVVARSDAGVARIRLLYDGVRIRSFTPPRGSHPHVLVGQIDWQHYKHLPAGRHTLVVQAFDPQGNVSRMAVSVVKP